MDAIRAPQQSTVDPTMLRYKGRRLFHPVNAATDDPEIATALSLNPKLLNEVQQTALKCIPDDSVLSMMCRDLTSELFIDNGREELIYAEPEVQFEDAPEGLDSDKYEASESAMQAHYIVAPSQFGFLKKVCHVSSPFWFPEYKDLVNNAMRVKTILHCNRVPGVQHFMPILPYAAVFSIPKLWANRVELVLRDLRMAMLDLFRDNYEIRIRGEFHRKRDQK